MPRYYFDTDDGERYDRDDAGLDLPDALAARRAAIEALPDMVRDKLPDGDRRTFAVSVRDESDTVLYTAKLNLVGEWRVTPPASPND